MNRSLLNIVGISPRKSTEIIIPQEERKTAPNRASRSSVSPASGDAESEENLARATAAVQKAKSVVIIPGYGMAIAQAQDEVALFARKMVEKGKEVKFAIHPVAGRMPGHMNVLLAEAAVDYEMLYEMDAVNPEFSRTDFVLIVGACDVVNPAAIHVEGTPISGMPILRAHEAKNVMVCNLDRRPGYSGVDNPLYDYGHVMLVLGDAKQTLNQFIKRIG
jgi:NAD(P) transhydrogenase subunit beta